MRINNFELAQYQWWKDEKDQLYQIKSIGETQIFVLDQNALKNSERLMDVSQWTNPHKKWVLIGHQCGHTLEEGYTYWEGIWIGSGPISDQGIECFTLYDKEADPEVKLYLYRKADKATTDEGWLYNHKKTIFFAEIEWSSFGGPTLMILQPEAEEEINKKYAVDLFGPIQFQSASVPERGYGERNWRIVGYTMNAIGWDGFDDNEEAFRCSGTEFKDTPMSRGVKQKYAVIVKED